MSRPEKEEGRGIMALSLVQFAAIAGGRAADLIKADDVRRSKEDNTAFIQFY